MYKVIPKIFFSFFFIVFRETVKSISRKAFHFGILGMYEFDEIHTIVIINSVAKFSARRSGSTS